MGQSKLRAEGTAALCKTGRLYRNVVFLSLVILLSAQYYTLYTCSSPFRLFLILQVFPLTDFQASVACFSAWYYA